MKGKILCLVLSIILSSMALTTFTAEGAQYRVAYIARAQADSFAAWLANEMRAEADRYDNITLTVFDGQANDERVNSMIENAIANRFDAIIIQANNGEAQRPYIERVVQAGIVCITTNPRVEGVAGASSVDADPYEQAAVNARVAVNQIPQNARVVILLGPAGNMHSTERRKAWQADFLDKRPDVTVVAEDIANWNKDEAMALMEDWVIAHGVVDAIISMNDNMCAGALEVVGGKPEFEGVFAYGVDGTAEALLLIADGKMTSTGLQSAIDLAKLNIEIVNKLLTGEETEVHVDIPAPLIDKSNVQEYIEIYTALGLIE
jgi:inositol transport system substrate-binding protein